MFTTLWADSRSVFSFYHNTTCFVLFLSFPVVYKILVGSICGIVITIGTHQSVTQIETLLSRIKMLATTRTDNHSVFSLSHNSVLFIDSAKIVIMFLISKSFSNYFSKYFQKSFSHNPICFHYIFSHNSYQ